MKPRKNPTPAQILRQLRRRPLSVRDPRYTNDAYWALRLQGYPHSYAKRVFRDERPKVIEQTAEYDPEYMAHVDPDDMLYPPGSTITIVEVAVRPPLSEETIADAKPRASEYTLWDQVVSGLGLRVRTSGHKTFILLFRIRGQRKLKKLTIGRAGNFNLQTAREIAREFRREARMGRDPRQRIPNLANHSVDQERRLGQLPSGYPDYLRIIPGGRHAQAQSPALTDHDVDNDP
jgi:hypothetical protein